MKKLKFVLIGFILCIVLIVIGIVSFSKNKDVNQTSTDLSETTLRDYVVEKEDITKSTEPVVQRSLDLVNDLGVPTIVYDRIYSELLNSGESGSVHIDSVTFNLDTYVFKYKLTFVDCSDLKVLTLSIDNKAGIPEEMVDKLKTYLDSRELYGNIIIQSYDESTYELTINVNGEEQIIKHWGEYHE